MGQRATTPSTRKISACIVVILNIISAGNTEILASKQLGKKYVANVFAAGSVRCYFCTVKLTSKDRQSMAAHRRQLTNSTSDNDGDLVPIYKPKLCSQFDGGERFQIDCPLSTLCQARTFKLHTQSRGSISVTTRGCARQDYSYQTYRKGRGWRTVTSVDEDAYDPGCFDAVGSDTLRRHRTTYCFCETDLCNGMRNDSDTTMIAIVSGQNNKVPNHNLILTSILLFIYGLTNRCSICEYSYL